MILWDKLNPRLYVLNVFASIIIVEPHINIRGELYNSQTMLMSFPTNSSNLCSRDVDKVCFVLRDFDGGIGSIFDCKLSNTYGGKSFSQTVYFPLSSCVFRKL